MNIPRHRVLLAAALLCASGATGCTTVRRIQPAQYFATNSPDLAWVTYTDNTVLPIAEPDLAGDTLKGLKQGTQEPVTIPMDQVLSISVRMPDNKKTGVLVAAGLVGLVASVYTLWISKTGPKTGGITCGFNEDGIAIPYC